MDRLSYHVRYENLTPRQRRFHDSTMPKVTDFHLKER